MQVNGLNNSIEYKPFSLQNNALLKGKLAGTTENAKDSNSISINQKEQNILELSNDAQLIAARNNKNAEVKFKKSGVTSAREAWENDSAKIVYDSRHDTLGGHDFLYMLRMDEPETYEKVCEAMSEANNYIYDEKVNGFTVATHRDEEARNKCFLKATEIEMEWFNRRCMSTGKFIDPISSRSSAIEKLEESYSKGGHDLSINFYGYEGQDEVDGAKSKFHGASLWRYSTKFNLLLSTDMLKTLADGDDKEKKDLLDKIDKSVSDMKKAEIDYEGNKQALCFGVKFHTDGSVTYHANYKDCEEPYGIQANSADELLEKLMADK